MVTSKRRRTCRHSIGFIAAGVIFSAAILALGAAPPVWHRPHPVLRMKWSPAPGGALGYVVAEYDTATAAVKYLDVTNTTTYLWRLAWKQPRRLAVVPIGRGCLIYRADQSDSSDVYVYDRAGAVIVPQGTDIKLELPPVPVQVQSMIPRGRWQVVGEADTGVWVDCSALTGSVPAAKYYRVKEITK